MNSTIRIFTAAAALFYLFAIVIMLASPVPARADRGDVWVIVHGFSAHLGSDGYTDTTSGEFRDYREFNPGIGVGFGLTDNLQARLGGFIGSFDNKAGYGGILVHTSLRRPLAVGVLALGITGYDDVAAETSIDYKRIQPAAAPVLITGTEQFKLELGYIPEYTEGTQDVVILSALIRFR